LVRPLSSTISAAPWPRHAWLKVLCSIVSPVLLACPTARKCTLRDFGLNLPRPGCLRNYTTAASELSRFPLMKLMHMPQVSDSGESNKHSHNALIHIAFPIVLQGRHSRRVISELNTAPMHSPANASPRHRWSSRHSSGPEWIATPYSAEDLTSFENHRGLTSYFIPVLTGAFRTSPLSRTTRKPIL